MKFRYASAYQPAAPQAEIYFGPTYAPLSAGPYSAFLEILE
jgi:hypothetical protein